MNDLNIIVGDCREEMAKLPEQSVQCVVTSPPYWGQRDYGTANFIGGNDPECDHIAPVNRRAAGFNKRYHGKEFATDKQGETPGAYTGKCGKCGAVRSSAGIGLEPDVHEWIDSMVEVFRGVWRVLRDDGTVWLNLGDKYNGSGGGGQSEEKRSKNWQPSYKKSNEKWLKQKDLIGLPWRMAFALQDDGWYLRRDIIWHKPNPMPESATDRPSTAHEYVFLLTKQPKYFYDQDAVRTASDSTQKSTPTGWDSSTGEGGHGTIHKQGRSLLPDNASRSKTSEIWDEQGYQKSGERNTHPLGANMRSVWTIPTQPFGGAHYATYPEKLVEPCVKAGSREGDTVLDPFSGAGTTGLVAMRLGRSYTDIELNPEYAAMSRKRIVERVGATSPDALKPDEQAQGRLI